MKDEQIEELARAIHGALSKANVMAYLDMPDTTPEAVAKALAPIIDRWISEAREWRPIELRPASAMGVLLYTPKSGHAGCKPGEDYSISIGHFDPVLYPDIFSGWFEQGTNHDCFESWREDTGTTPTHWQPLPTPPETDNA